MRPSLLVTVALLAGCASQTNANLQAGIKREAAACRAEIPSVIGNYVRQAQCLAAVSERFSPPNDTAAPLIRATLLSLAAKVARGEISPEDARLQLAQVIYELRERDRMDAEAARDRQAASGAAMVGAGAALLAPPPNIYIVPRY